MAPARWGKDYTVEMNEENMNLFSTRPGKPTRGTPPVGRPVCML